MDELSSNHLVQMIEESHIYSVVELASHLPYTVVDVIYESYRLGYLSNGLNQNPDKVMIIKK